MSLTDALLRIDCIAKKYEGYTKETAADDKAATKDPFSELYNAIDAEIENLIQRTVEVSIERNRAVAAAINAEIRRGKEVVGMELGRLEKLAYRKVKGVPESELDSRRQMVEQLWEKIRTISDAAALPRPKKSAVQPFNVSLDIAEAGIAGQSTDYFKSTDETRGFRDEYTTRAKKQDSQLDYISTGLDRLKNIAQDMAQELENQAPVLDHMEDQMTAATTQLRNNNKRMAELILEVRSTRMFCIDMILIVILLGIGCYLYKLLA